MMTDFPLSAIYPLSSHQETRDHTRRLPVELFTYTLDLLAQPDVLRAAGVCRRWRAIARRHRNFYRHIAYGSPAARWWYCDSAPLSSSCQWQQPMFWRSARAFQRSVDEASKDGVRVSLRVQVANCPRGSVVFATSLDRKVHDTLVGFVIPALERSLPLACKLHLEIPTVFGELFMRALSGSEAEAPLLRRVYLYAEGGGGSSTVEIPTQILGGGAPKSRSLACEGPIVWSGEPCPAFSRVTTLECPVGPTFFADALRLFPRVFRLVCDIGRLSQITESFVAQHKEAIPELLSQLQSLRLTLECDLPSSCTNKGGLQLVELVSNHSRTIRDVHVCLRGVEVDRFPPIRGLFEDTPLAAPCVLAMEKATSPALGNLSRHSELYYRDFANPTASVLLEMNAIDGSLSRTVEVHSVTPATAWFFSQISPAGDAIVKLRVWHGYLEGNLPFFASLPRVAELEVDVRSSPPMEWNPEKRVRSRELGRILAAIWKRTHGGTSPIPRGDAALHCDLSREPFWPSLHRMRLFNSDVTRRTSVSVRGSQLVAFAHLLGLCDPRRPIRPTLHIAAGVVVDAELSDSLKEYFSDIRRDLTLCL